MKRLLLVSPHYPPDNSAGAHRARVLAPYLGRYGWQTTVLTVDRSAYEGTLDEELATMSHGDVEVLRAPAWSARWTRRLGVGDLGLRALQGLRAAAGRELARRRYDALYVTTYPVYPAVIAPAARRRFGVPFVLDLQDPWVGAWGETVGPGADGRPNLKSRLSRSALAALERHVVPQADALTSVSSALLEHLRATYPALAGRAALELPIGIDPCDLAWVGRHRRAPQFFDAADGNVHLCYVGTLLPLATEVLRAFLMALRRSISDAPDLTSKLRVHFIGTSNQSTPDAAPRVLPHARELGVGSVVSEHAPRIPYADALRCQTSASALLVLGSTEARYTASKIAPALASGRPVLIFAHRDSDAVRAAARVADVAVRLVTFDEARPPRNCGPALCDLLRDWSVALPLRSTGLEAIAELTAPRIAERLAVLLDEVLTPR